MAKKDKKGKMEQLKEVETKVDPVVVVEEKPEEKAEKKKYYYNPVAAKAYRDRVRQAAIVGGYVPKERKLGTGQTEKRTSKSGKDYYYTPWSKLTEEQKKDRLASARARAAQEREDAKKYREEHPEGVKSD